MKGLLKSSFKKPPKLQQREGWTDFAEEGIPKRTTREKALARAPTNLTSPSMMGSREGPHPMIIMSVQKSQNCPHPTPHSETIYWISLRVFLSRQNFISTVATKWKTLCFQERFLLPECAKYTHFLPEVFWKKVQWSWPFLYLGKEVHFLGHFGAPNWSFQCHFLSAGTPLPAKRSSLLATKIFVIKSFQVAGHICALEHECAIMHSCGIKFKKKKGGVTANTAREKVHGTF